MRTRAGFTFWMVCSLVAAVLAGCGLSRDPWLCVCLVEEALQ